MFYRSFFTSHDWVYLRRLSSSDDLWFYWDFISFHFNKSILIPQQKYILSNELDEWTANVQQNRLQYRSRSVDVILGPLWNYGHISIGNCTGFCKLETLLRNYVPQVSIFLTLLHRHIVCWNSPDTITFANLVFVDVAFHWEFIQVSNFFNHGNKDASIQHTDYSGKM